MVFQHRIHTYYQTASHRYTMLQMFPSPGFIVTSTILVLLTVSTPTGAVAPPESSQTFRLYDGIAAYIPNPDAKNFAIDLDIRDLNIFADGPRELLVKVYDPDGRVLIREIIPDDGMVGSGYEPAQGGWDHEFWYHPLCYPRGSQPMIRFSAFSDPARLHTFPARPFPYPIDRAVAGIYRLVVTGATDHY